MHPQFRIGPDTQLAEGNPLPKPNFYIGRPQVQAPGGNQHREGGVELVEILDYQRLGADRTVDIRFRGKVSESRRDLAKRLDRRLDAHAREREGVLRSCRRADGALQGKCRQGLAGLAQRVTEREKHGQEHVPRALKAIGEFAVGIECPLRLAQDTQKPAKLPRRNGWRGNRSGGRPRRSARFSRRGHAGKFDQLQDVLISGVDLRFAEKNGSSNDLGFCLSQDVGHLCVDLPRPRPATQVGHGDIVDCNDRNAV